MSLAYSQFSDYIYQRTGIVINQDKNSLVDSRLNPVLDHYDFGSLDELMLCLRTIAPMDLEHAVIHAMTTNETSFVRDLTFFEGLRNVLLPKLINQRSTKQKLTIWSAACSSGQEPYSVLMTIKEYFPELKDWKLNFLCTDLDQNMLKRTRQGTYSSLEVNRGLPVSWMNQYFSQNGSSWEISQELRAQLTIRKQNLLEAWSNIPTCDLILMRNVMIYFDTKTRSIIYDRIKQHLSADGALVLGASETTLGVTTSFGMELAGEFRYYTLKSDTPWTNLAAKPL